MESALAFVFSAGIVGFGVLILIAGPNSSAPALWLFVALVPVAIGVASAIGPS